MADDSLYKAFGNAVSVRRRALGTTQAALAAKVNMSRASIANIESGRQNVLLHHVYDLAAALECAKLSDLLPPRPQKSFSPGELEMLLLDKTISESAGAQIGELIKSALGQRRGPRSGS